jgi:serine/threonine protein kinase
VAAWGKSIWPVTRACIAMWPSRYSQSKLAWSPDRRQRFEREARAVAALNHPNICAVYQFGSDRGRDYLVLEYLDGCTLLKRLREGALLESEWKRAAQEISSALEYAHEQGVIHRDVKPGNIMLTRAGAKLLDFSVAKQVSAVFRSVATSSPSTVLTKEGSIVGTVAYMSPEQAEGKPVDARSDIFSFGCVLYEMITGQPAFHGNSDLSVLAAILNSEPADLRGLPPDSPASLLNVMDRCLRKRPEERFQTMAEVSQALARIDEQEDIHGGEPSTSTWQPGGLPALVQRAGQVASDRSLAVGAALLAVLAACFVFWNIHRVSPVHPRSLAVLPFANASKNPEMEYLADGLSESLTNTFSRASNMRVTARSVAFAYKGRDADVRRIGRDLRVESVVMGSVTSAAGRMRVQAELVDTRDGTQLWGQQYEGTFNDALKIRDDIMRQLSERMQGRVEIQEGGAHGRPTQNPKAFQLYLKGRHALSRYSVADVQRAISYFDKALEMDPNYALAYAGLAESYWTLSGNALPPGEAFPKAKAAAQRAAALDPGLPDAHVALG